MAIQNFVFYNPVKIIFGENQIAEIANEIPKEAKVLITYGGGSIKKNGVYDQVIKALENHTVLEFAGIEPNPKYETLMQAIEVCRKESIDFVLAVGGGSVIDGTKFIVAGVNYAGDPWELVAKREPGAFISSAPDLTSAVPFGTVLTLPATSSEMNCGAVISRKDSADKLAFSNPLLFPKFSILDPVTTYTLPDNQTSNGIIDIYIHVIEQYLTIPMNAPIQDRMAEGILKTLIEEAPKVMQNGKDYDARANIMWAGAIGLNGWISPGVAQDWATHMLGHELTAKYGLDHGQTLAIILPSLMDVKRQQKREKILQYARRVLGISSGSDEEIIDQAINKTREFFEGLGVKTHLSDYGITADGIADIVAQLDKHGLTALGEHGDIDLNASEEILRHAL